MEATDYIQIRITPAEKEVIKTRAKSLGVTVADFVMAACSDMLKREGTPNYCPVCGSMQEPYHDASGACQCADCKCVYMSAEFFAFNKQ